MAITKSPSRRDQPFIKRTLQCSSYTWMIEDFRRRKEKQGVPLISPAFTSDHDISFQASLYPNGTEDSSFIGVFLGASSTCPSWVKARFSCKILDKNGDTKYRKICKDALTGGGGKVGWTKFYPKRKILDALNAILRNGQLTLVLEVFYIDDNISDEHMNALLTLSPFSEPKSKSGSDDLKQLWEGKRFDHSFKVGEKLIPIHRTVLASSSPILDKALIRDRRTFYPIDDSYDSSTVKDIVYFLYHAAFEYKPNTTQLKQMLRFSQQYDIAILTFHTEKLLYESCNSENILDTFLTAQQFNSINLCKIVKFVIIENIHLVTGTRVWYDLMAKEPKFITNLVTFLGEELRRVRSV